MKKLFLLTAIAITLLLTSCNPSDLSSANESNTINPAGVYVTGFYGNDACYWKDGVITVLRNSTGNTHSSAYSIFVLGNDVYTAGEIQTGSVTYATYWKNGTEHILSNLESHVSSITVSGNDVYVLGSIIDANGVFVPHYWKNGVATTFNANGYDGGNDIKVVNDDVYICGSISNVGMNVTPVYWKNGVMTILPTSAGYQGEAAKMIFKGNDMYISGQFFGTTNKGMYWKNGNIENVFADGIETTGMAISGNDVYISGSRYDAALNSNKSKYWKNGVEFNVSNNSNKTITAAIAVKSNNVFIAEYMTGAGCASNGNMNTIINGINVNVVENANPSSIFVVE
jgi:uncharacterized membrane protein